ncbi:hypothetical protein ACI782_22080 [Geodermatophilus sp. SYSU D00703]
MSATARAAGVPPEPRRAPGAARRVAPRAVPIAPDRSSAARIPVAAPDRSGRAHSVPVRTGALRTRPARSLPTGPTPRPVAAAAPTRARGGLFSRRQAPLVVLVVAMLVATSLALLFLNTAIAVNSLKATQLAGANADRAQEVERLEQLVVDGSTPAALASAAADAGLVPAGSAAYLVIGEDGTVTLRGEPVPAGEPGTDPESGTGG